MSSRVGSVLVLFLASLPFLLSSPALAQYMYLDSNGDGLHTIADAVNPAGPTTVDVWLDIAANRDGTLVPPCPQDPSAPVNINSYVVALRASGGAIAWGTFTNRQPTMTIHFGQHSSVSEFEDGYGGAVFLPPGRYHLATLVLSVQSGSPAIDIVPSVSISVDVTSFGSLCLGNDFDYTLKLGSDWQDADGLPFGTGGSPNQPPLLNQPGSMAVLTGELASQEITATDADQQPLTFGKAAGPSFMTVSNTGQGIGTATGTIALTPLASDVGTSTGTVSVTDGFATVSKSFSIQVSAGPNHTPTLESPEAIRVIAGTTPRIAIRSVDPDGQPLVFQKSAGPDFLAVTTLVSGPGGAVGALALTPGACDVGEASAQVDVSDGLATTTRGLAITVQSRRPAPSQPPPTPANASVLALGDLNHDGHVDIVTGGMYSSFASWLGQGDGTMAPSATLTLSQGGEVVSAILGDWNGDGHLDAAARTFGAAAASYVTVLMGNGSGGLTQGPVYPVDIGTGPVQAGDLDHDGDLDLVVTHGSKLGVFLGQGDGTFAARVDYAMGFGPHGLVLADFNTDGRLDAATANSQSDDVLIRAGLGDGTFGDAQTVLSMDGAFELVAGDWNGDGRADLAAASFDDGDIRILQGNGQGGFTPGAVISGIGGQPSLAAVDLDQDGREDLIVSTFPLVADAPTLQVAYGRGDGTFAPNRVITSQYYGGVATADLNEDGFPDIDTADGAAVVAWLNDAGGAGVPEARAFAQSKAPGGGKPTTCVRLEPVAGSYENENLDLTSLTLSSDEGNGSIQAVSTKAAVIGDTDGNGIAEVPACFSRDGLSALFDAAHGRQTVTAHLEGALVDGRRFCASVSLDIVGTGTKLAASVSPNPLNPGGILRLTTSRDGFVRVRMFDLQGRVVRVLEDRAMVPAGAHDVRIDGRNASGQTLASGIYFYQVETVEGSLRGRITVLK